MPYTCHVLLHDLRKRLDDGGSTAFAVETPEKRNPVQVTEEGVEEMNDLANRRCTPCEGGVPPLEENAVKELLVRLPAWQIAEGGIARDFTFKNFWQTMAFVNAVAWIAHTENHHPEMEVSYRSCRVRYSTHAVGGLTENDFICAAKVDALLQDH